MGIGRKHLDGHRFLRKALGYLSIEEGLSGEFDRQFYKVEDTDQPPKKGYTNWAQVAEQLAAIAELVKGNSPCCASRALWCCTAWGDGRRGTCREFNTT